MPRGSWSLDSRRANRPLVPWICPGGFEERGRRCPSGAHVTVGLDRASKRVMTSWFRARAFFVGVSGNMMAVMHRSSRESCGGISFSSSAPSRYAPSDRTDLDSTLGEQVPVSELSFVDPNTGEDRTEAVRGLMREKAPELLELVTKVGGRRRARRHEKDNSAVSNAGVLRIRPSLYCLLPLFGIFSKA